VRRPGGQLLCEVAQDVPHCRGGVEVQLRGGRLALAALKGETHLRKKVPVPVLLKKLGSCFAWELGTQSSGTLTRLIFAFSMGGNACNDQ
jgi:hypothetical protein